MLGINKWAPWVVYQSPWRYGSEDSWDLCLHNTYQFLNYITFDSFDITIKIIRLARKTQRLYQHFSLKKLLNVRLSSNWLGTVHLLKELGSVTLPVLRSCKINSHVNLIDDLARIDIFVPAIPITKGGAWGVLENSHVQAVFFFIQHLRLTWCPCEVFRDGNKVGSSAPTPQTPTSL